MFLAEKVGRYVKENKSSKPVTKNGVVDISGIIPFPQKSVVIMVVIVFVSVIMITEVVKLCCTGEVIVIVLMIA